MSILTKPWLDDGKAFEQAPGGGGANLKTTRLGLFVFIGVATALFSLFATAYYMRMMLGGWQVLDEPWILWPNTGVLLMGSVMMHLATRFSRRGDRVLARRMFMAGGGAGIVFSIGSGHGLAAIDRAWGLRSGQSGQCLFLHDYRSPWPASFWWPGGLGPGLEEKFPWGRCG